jgi:GNAT superfamily N-acetyltransferase
MLLQASAFDTEHYGLAIASLARTTDADDLDAAIAAGRAAGYAVLFVRLPDSDPWCSLLAARGHQPVDTLVTSKLVGSPAIAHPEIAVEHHATVAGADADAVVAITTATIQTSHLHADSRLPIDKTRALYATWIRNDLAGRAALTLLARDAGTVIGYCAVVVRGETAVIDLIAVHPAWHGRGVGSALIASFTRWVAEHGYAATVGTQASNAALRLYRRCGFVPISTQLTYHLWLDG